MLLSTVAFGQTQQTFPAYVTSRTPATSPLSGQCFPVSNGTITSKLCSGYAVAIGALSAANNLSDLGNLASARLNLFNGVPFGALNKCLGLDNAGNIISGPCIPQTITSITLSNTAVIGGTPGTTVGTISVSLSPASPAFVGTLTVDDVTHFIITGNTLQTNGALSSGNYPITITASESTITTPVSQAFTIAVQSLQSIALSNNTIVGGQPGGTVVGAITVVMAPASPPFTGSLSVAGTNASSFAVVGNNLVTQGIVGSGNYSINIVASQHGVSISQPETISVIQQTISQVILSNTAVIGGSGSAGEVVGNVHVIMSPAFPAFIGSLSLTGSNASSFVLSGNQISVGGSTLSNGTSYNFNIVASQGNALGSPFTQAETVTPAALTWVNDQTQPMPYVCLKQIWVNPSPSASGATGGGKSALSGGMGTQANPFLHLTDIYTSQIAISPGTCVNLLNSTTDFESVLFGTCCGASQIINQQGIFINAPDGYFVIRSTDNTGAIVEAAAIGGSINTSAATLWANNLSANNIGNIDVVAPTDYVIIDGIHFVQDGAQRMQLQLPCVQVGSNPGFNTQGGLTHFQARAVYVDRCGQGGFNIGGSDYVNLDHNVIRAAPILGQLQESGISVGFSASAPNYTPAGYDAVRCTTMNSSCINYHHVVSGNLISDTQITLNSANTDGNCYIEDTDIADPSSSNAGPFLGRTLVVNNVAYNCGARAFETLKSQHIDFVNNTGVVGYYDLHNNDTARRLITEGLSGDINFVNNITYMMGADTFVNSTGTGVTLSVDNVRGWLNTGLNQPPSSSCQPNLTVDGVANTLVAVPTIDQTNISTVPGGLSGTLTFNTSVASPHGNSGVLVIATNPFNNNGCYNSALVFNGPFGDSEFPSTSVNTCVNWSNPCTAFSLLMDDSSIFFYNNLGELVANNFLTSFGTGVASGYCPNCGQPPTLGPPGNNLYLQDPTFTNVVFPISSYFSMVAINNVNPGTTCAVGELLTLAGGSPVSSDAAVVQVDGAVSGMIVSSHVFHSGTYSSNTTTTFTVGSATGNCTGAAFNAARFVQAFDSTARPDIHLQGGSPALNAGNSNYCPSHNFFGTARSCPTNMGAY